MASIVFEMTEDTLTGRMEGDLPTLLIIADGIVERLMSLTGLPRAQLLELMDEVHPDIEAAVKSSHVATVTGMK